jgi:hypothetical protein
VPRDTTYPQSVAATFDLAIDEAVARCRAAEDIMAFLGFCAPSRIPMYLLQSLADSEEAITTLAELSLLRHDPFADGLSAISVHRLVQAVARRRSEVRGTTKAVMDGVQERLLVDPPAPSARVRWLARLSPILRSLPHQQALYRHHVQYIITEYERLANRYDQVADQFEAVGNKDKAKELRDKAVKLRAGTARLRESRLAKERA